MRPHEVPVVREKFVRDRGGIRNDIILFAFFQCLNLREAELKSLVYPLSLIDPWNWYLYRDKPLDHYILGSVLIEVLDNGERAVIPLRSACAESLENKLRIIAIWEPVISTHRREVFI